MSAPDLMFRAFADETRLRILHLLSRGELCVCDITETMRAPQSKISRHLAYLRKSGLVSDRKDGLWRYYALAKTESRLQQRIIDCLGQCFDEIGVLEKDATRLKNLKLNRKRCE